MRRFVIIFSIIGICLMAVQDASAQMDPKIKALGSMALYGTIGGAILGTASMAFGGESMNIAKGASLGLYAGLLFGGYVVVSHMWAKSSRDKVPDGSAYPEDSQTPYKEDTNSSDDYGGPGQAQDDSYWRPQTIRANIRDDYSSQSYFGEKHHKRELKFYVPIFQYFF